MYKHDRPILCLPSFRSWAPYRSTPGTMYRVRFCLRGEKPVRNQSPDWPLSYLYLYEPNPTMLSPHSFGSSPVSSRMRASSAKASCRFAGSATLSRNALTLFPLGFVFSSDMAASSVRMKKEGRRKKSEGHTIAQRALRLQRRIVLG